MSHSPYAGRMATYLLFVAALGGYFQAGQPAVTGVLLLRQEAADLLPQMKSDLAKDFLRATERLPAMPHRTLFEDPDTKLVYSKRAMAQLSEAQRRKLRPRVFDESFYYTTKYGTPLAYARPLELLGQAGIRSVARRRILDFGYGTVGHLRLLANLRADLVGVDVDPLLRELYTEPGDQGAIANPDGPGGRITLVNGRFPADQDVRKQVGGGYDLILSKNTLKRGYIHPSRPADPKRLIHLGVEDAAFLKALYDSLNPGGWLLIYNLSPAQSPPDQPYKPWADGTNPFPRSLWQAAGFKVISFDVDDSEAARAMAHALKWDQGDGAMNLEKDLFAHYSLLQKPK
jgi:hypothetical protein